MENKKANNILDFLFDPTRIPVQQRLYFRPEEILRNESYEKAKADAEATYGTQHNCSDFYPSKNKNTKREAFTMDRKSIIASFDILSKNFQEGDPIGQDLRTMALAVSKMSKEELDRRLLADSPEVQEVEAKKKKEEPEAEPVVEEVVEEVNASEIKDNWTKDASDLISKALLADVLGITAKEKKEEEVIPEACMMKKEEKLAKKPAEEKAVPEEKAEVAPEEVEKSAKKGLPEWLVPFQKKDKKDEKKKASVETAEETTATVVDTDILLAMSFGDNGNESIDEVEMTAEEKERLGSLFQ